MEELKPKLGTEAHCAPDCPFLESWEHPYYHCSGWCWKQMKDLSWYDYYLADCVSNKPHDKLKAESGNKFKEWKSRIK